jgi:hypothetical protein
MNKIVVSTAGLFATALAVGFAIGSAAVNAADLPLTGLQEFTTCRADL